MSASVIRTALDFAFTKCDGGRDVHALRHPRRRLEDHDLRPVERQMVDGLSTPVRLAGGAALNMGEIAHQPVAGQHLHLDLPRPERRRRPQDPGEPGLAAGRDQHPVPRRQLSPTSTTPISNGYAGFNESLPAVQLVRGRDGLDPLQEHRDARGLRRRRARRRQLRVRQRRPPAVRQLQHRREPGEHERGHLGAVQPARPGRVLLRQRRLPDAPAPLAPGGTGGSTGRVDPALGVEQGWQGFAGQNSSWSSARSRSPLARTAASTAMWSTPRRVRSTIRRCSSS